MATNNMVKYFFCGRVPWLYQYWPGGLMLFVVLCPGTPEGSTGSGSCFKASQKTGQRLKSHLTDWKKPGIEPATPGLQDIGLSPTPWRLLKNIVFNYISIQLQTFCIRCINRDMMVCATSKGSEQPAHTRSLIRAFASRLNIL